MAESRSIERFTAEVLDKANELSESAKTFREMFKVIDEKLDMIMEKLKKLEEERDFFFQVNASGNIQRILNRNPQ